LDPTRAAEFLGLFGTTKSYQATNSYNDLVFGMLEQIDGLVPFGQLGTQQYQFGTNAYAYNWDVFYTLESTDPTLGSFLVSDTLIATPIPAALFMFAPALLGFFGFRRKMQA